MASRSLGGLAYSGQWMLGNEPIYSRAYEISKVLGNGFLSNANIRRLIRQHLEAQIPGDSPILTDRTFEYTITFFELVDPDNNSCSYIPSELKSQWKTGQFFSERTNTPFRQPYLRYSAITVFISHSSSWLRYC